MSRSRRSRFRWRTQPAPGAIDRADQLVRWVGDDIHEHSRQPLGIFQLALRARRNPATADEARIHLRTQLGWFSLHLARPRRFSPHRDGWRRTTYGRWLRTPIAISWFKAAAHEHLRRAEDLAACLRGLGIAMRMLTTDRPGYVTYEDAFQVVAVPFA